MTVSERREIQRQLAENQELFADGYLELRADVSEVKLQQELAAKSWRRIEKMLYTIIIGGLVDLVVQLSAQRITAPGAGIVMLAQYLIF